MPTEEIKNGEEQSGPDLLSDCRLMLRFARKEARTIPAELSADIGRLDSILKHLGLPAVSTIPEDLIPDIDKTGSGEALSPTELILKVHGALSQIVAPATAQSLQVSEPPPAKHPFPAAMPSLLKTPSWIATYCPPGLVLSI